MDTTINIIIVDDHDSVRHGLKIALDGEESIKVIGEAENGAKAVQLCGHLRPHVVLMDLVMPEMNGLEATRLIRKVYPETQVVILTSFENETSVQEVLSTGAISYIVKNLSIDDLANTIVRAQQGESIISKELIRDPK